MNSSINSRPSTPTFLKIDNNKNKLYKTNCMPSHIKSNLSLEECNNLYYSNNNKNPTLESIKDNYYYAPLFYKPKDSCYGNIIKFDKELKLHVVEKIPYKHMGNTNEQTNYYLKIKISNNFNK